MLEILIDYLVYLTTIHHITYISQCGCFESTKDSYFSSKIFKKFLFNKALIKSVCWITTITCFFSKFFQKFSNFITIFQKFSQFPNFVSKFLEDVTNNPIFNCYSSKFFKIFQTFFTIYSNFSNIFTIYLKLFQFSKFFSKFFKICCIFLSIQ